MIILLSLSLFSSCVPSSRVPDIKPIIDSLQMKDSVQVLLVANQSASSIGTNVFAIEKKDGKWKQALDSFPGVIGRNGFAAPGEKREGDGKSPSGIFALNTSFGYEKSISTKMPYRQVTDDDLWVDDVNAPDYNRWVKKESTQALSYEKMKREDDLYKYGLIIEYNTDPVIPGYGSAIFFHIWKGEGMATAGCVATSEDNIIKILGWLDPQSLPLIIMGTESIIERLVQ